jgi:succinate dehydrogenase hydrophobic anchor subunit
MVLALAAYMLLNVFVGFSSAPFYAQIDSCSSFNPNKECVALRRMTTNVYVCELLVGLYLLVQSAMAVILHDNIRAVKLANVLKISCMGALVFFVFMGILRLIAYLIMHKKLVQVDPEHTDKGLGSFVAEYFDGSTAATVVALCLLGYMVICYLSNIYMVHILKRLIEFLNSQRETAKVSDSILQNP